jgi:hypothetical protein
MVSRKQRFLIKAVFLATSITVMLAEDAAKRFFPDDPMWSEPEPHASGQVAVRKVDDLYDFLANSYVTPRKAAKRGPQPARGVNTLGEVPDSAWYTNRHWRRHMSTPELVQGPGNTTPPDMNGTWRVVSAKSNGVTPGFVIEDSRKNRYVIKFDPVEFPEMASAADVIGSKFFYALGYHTPENYVVHFRRDHLALSGGITWKDSGGKKHPLTDQVIDQMLKPLPQEPSGGYRALASRWIPGEIVGPFSYVGTRSDDPNDLVPHEDRRDLRGLAVFSAWMNHTDTRQINSMDTLVSENGRQYLKHYLLDFGSILGSDGNSAKDPRLGHEYTIASKQEAVQMVTLGFYVPRWMRSRYPNLRGAGVFDSESFDPLSWRPSYPNPAFVMMDREDAFWAAKQVAAFTDDEIRAVVKTGEFSDPRTADWIADCLIKRRDKIGRAWFSQVLPLDNFRVEDGSLAFDDLRAKYGFGPAQAYDVRWYSYDNATDGMQALPGAGGKKIPAAAEAHYLAAAISCSGSSDGACSTPVTVYVRQASSSFEIVGLVRRPAEKIAGTKLPADGK